LPQAQKWGVFDCCWELCNCATKAAQTGVFKGRKGVKSDDMQEPVKNIKRPQNTQLQAQKRVYFGLQVRCELKVEK
jgi:hypothetical protein